MVKGKALIGVVVGLLATALYVLPAVAELGPQAGKRAPLALTRTLVLTGVRGAVLPTIPPPPTLTATPTSTIPAPPWPISVKLEGIITQIAPDVPGEWRIDDTPILVTAETVISAPEGHTPQMGDRATVNATRISFTLIANRITIHADEGEQHKIEFRGVIADLPSEPYLGWWRIGGVAVLVESRATIIIQVTPTVGYYAHVQGWIRSDRRVDAVTIEILDPTLVAEQFEFQGAIEEMAPSIPGTWVIGGVRGLVTESTVIEGAVSIGAQVQVKGRRSSDGALAFGLIRVLTPDEREVRLAGSIVTFNEEYWVVNDAQAGDTEIRITDSTFIDESRCRAASGMWADVIAQRGSGGRLSALRIRVERPD